MNKPINQIELLKRQIELLNKYFLSEFGDMYHLKVGAKRPNSRIPTFYRYNILKDKYYVSGKGRVNEYLKAQGLPNREELLSASKIAAKENEIELKFPERGINISKKLKEGGIVEPKVKIVFGVNEKDLNNYIAGDIKETWSESFLKRLEEAKIKLEKTKEQNEEVVNNENPKGTEWDLSKFEFPNEVLGDYKINKDKKIYYFAKDVLDNKIVFENPKGKRIILTQNWQPGRDVKITIATFLKEYKDLGGIENSGHLNTFSFIKGYDTPKDILQKIKEITSKETKEHPKPIEDNVAKDKIISNDEIDKLAEQGYLVKGSPFKQNGAEFVKEHINNDDSSNLTIIARSTLSDALNKKFNDTYNPKWSENGEIMYVDGDLQKAKEDFTFFKKIIKGSEVSSEDYSFIKSKEQKTNEEDETQKDIPTKLHDAINIPDVQKQAIELIKIIIKLNKEDFPNLNNKEELSINEAAELVFEHFIRAVKSTYFKSAEFIENSSNLFFNIKKKDEN